MTFAESVTTHLNEICGRVDELSRKDVSTVAKSIEGLIGDHARRDPLETLATAFGVGFGLGVVGSEDLKRAGLYVAKLVAYQLLSKNIEIGGMNEKGKSTRTQSRL